MFIGYQKDKIVLVANTRKELENNPFIYFDRVEQTADTYVLYKGEYILKAQAEEKEVLERKENHLQELKNQLDILDLKSIRPLRAKEAGTATQVDLDKLIELEEEINKIRKEIRELKEGSK